jgi:hypothetical protein
MLGFIMPIMIARFIQKDQLHRDLAGKLTFKIILMMINMRNQNLKQLRCSDKIIYKWG